MVNLTATPAVSDWPDTKDHLVGQDLNEYIDSLVKWPSIVGFVLLISSMGLVLTKRLGRTTE